MEDILVFVEGHILQSKLLDQVRGLLTVCEAHDLIVLSVSEEEGRLLVRPLLGQVVLDTVAQQKVARKTEDTAELLLARQSGEDGHRTTLRESTEDDAGRLDALVHFLLDELVEVLARAEDTRLILCADVFLEVELWTLVWIESCWVGCLRRGRAWQCRTIRACSCQSSEYVSSSFICRCVRTYDCDGD